MLHAAHYNGGAIDLVGNLVSSDVCFVVIQKNTSLASLSALANHSRVSRHVLSSFEPKKKKTVQFWSTSAAMSHHTLTKSNKKNSSY